MDTIAAGIHQVSAGSNAFIIDGDDGVVLVDTGLPGRHGPILAGLESIGRSPEDIRAIVVTHAHVDHLGGAAALVSSSGAPLHVSAEDAPVARGERRPSPPPFLDRVPMLGSLVGRILPTPPPVEVDRTIGDEDLLPGDLRVIATPGHTPGHVTFLLDRHGGVAFVGDAALAKNGSIARGFFNAPTPAIDASIRRLGTLEFEIACFGHSDAVTARASAAFARF